MTNFFTNFYHEWLYLPFISLINFLESDIAWLVVLIVVFFVLVNIKGKIDKRNLSENKIKNKVIPKLISLLTFIIVALILIVSYSRFGPAIIKFYKSSESKQSPTQITEPKTKTNPEIQSPTTQQTLPTYEEPKRMYYSIDCSGCWAEGCPNSGYNYSGYDSYYYTYYTALCRACSCNSLNGRSFWK